MSRNRRRRWPWLLLGLAGGGVVVWCALLLDDPLIDYFRRPWDERDQIASVISMFVGVAALLVSIVGLIVAMRQGGQPADQAGTVQNITASEQGAVAQGVINGNIVNHPEKPASDT